MKSKILYVLICTLCFYYSYSQENKSVVILNQLLKIENGDSNDIDKLAAGEKLKNEFNISGIPKDSVYARILHKIGVWKCYGENNINAAIVDTKESIKINLSNSPNTSPGFVAYSYFNLGVYYESLQLYNESLKALDSVSILVNTYNGDNYLVLKSALLQGQMYFTTGNYQKSIDAITHALSFNKSDIHSGDVAKLYIERAFSKVSMGMVKEALADLGNAGLLLQGNNKIFQGKADFYKAKAFVWESINNNDSASMYYKLALNNRLLGDNNEALVNEYSDLAVFLSKSPENYTISLKYYKQAIALALTHNFGQSLINLYVNFSDLYIRNNFPLKALENCQIGLVRLIPQFKPNSDYDNPELSQVLKAYNYYSAYALLANKAEALLLEYKEAKNRKAIETALETSKLADLIIDELRNNQVTLHAKLFWQKKTRNFYRIAIDVSYLANDPASILYFMEKSRAVLLNDKLNELGSLAYLPAAEAEQEQQLRINIASLEKQKQALSEKDTAYNRVSQALLHAKEDFNQFIKTLETKFPVYYQYKYSASVPSIADIRSKLLTNEQIYLSFFETDSVVYALLISKSDVQFKKLAFPGYADTVNVFAQLCKDRQLLNSSYSRYASLANMLYKKLFEPLNVPKGKVIVSPDLNFIPLDALTIDEAGKSFLLYDYTFDYTYSAGYLIKTMNIALQKGAGFLGIAPESFSSNLSLAKLYGSAASLESIFDKYSYGQLLKYSQATRSFFLNKAGTFNLLHLYAHAKADGDSEPVLYMNDSAVAVSELHQWNNPKVGLAFLAACETGAGELNIGEGINSIARSFAAIGVPSTIATLWKADNKAMYAISERFYSYLNQGLTKDEALQKAKIDFIASGSGENALPYYWASAVLSGNAAPVKLPAQNTSKKYWLIPLLFAFATGAVYYRRKTYRRKTASANI